MNKTITCIHKFLKWAIENPHIQLLAGITIVICVLLDIEKTLVHHGVVLYVIWSSLPSLVQAFERIVKGIK